MFSSSLAASLLPPTGSSSSHLIPALASSSSIIIASVFSETLSSASVMICLLDSTTSPTSDECLPSDFPALINESSMSDST
ncbi:hypothetical protein MtrunA17_Chr5g0393621 [Medicago truncatula]|uniref:Uncharacterized protein n=1 Tax=Medicago truncatula TaxID=3880 RepID=A0A396HJ03_MEDTR|nr:hypothetical protein MtrunA17_Chr5g0393621 [Medicago truncatula]